MALGGITGAIVGGFIGGSTGCVAGAKLGVVFDDTILKNYQCVACGYTFGTNHI